MKLCVSILVLMESGFLRPQYGTICSQEHEVSILVLMESGFLQEEDGYNYIELVGFYPCFNGIRVLTMHPEVNYQLQLGFLSLF